MKNVMFSIFFGLVLSSNAFAASTAPEPVTVLLEYRYNNQVVGSGLQILSNGSASRTEKSCCPPKQVLAETRQLSAEDLKSLKSLIVTASKGNIKTESISGRLGELFGLLTVTTTTGEKITIYSKDIHQLRVNESGASADIIKLVNGYVSQKMPETKTE